VKKDLTKTAVITILAVILMIVAKNILGHNPDLYKIILRGGEF